MVAVTIVAMATARGRTKTICPSEVARHLWPDEWRNHMPEVRDAACKLRDNKQVRIMQKGKEMAGNHVKGPIRIQII